MQDEGTPFVTLVATLESSLFFLSFFLPAGHQQEGKKKLLSQLRNGGQTCL
jgi:hypothetical protein